MKKGKLSIGYSIWPCMVSSRQDMNGMKNYEEYLKKEVAFRNVFEMREPMLALTA
jgi:hypothetical protein